MKCTGKILGTHRTHCKRMKQALVRLPNERPECNDIKLGDCLRLLRTHRGGTIVVACFPAGSSCDEQSVPIKVAAFCVYEM